MSFGSGQADFLKDTPEAVAQVVKTRLLLWLNEWYLDLEEGTPYLEGILGKHDLSTAETVLRSRVLETQDVDRIEDFSLTLNPDTRGLSCSLTLVTIYGITTFKVDT